jgi:hypothetical protein
VVHDQVSLDVRLRRYGREVPRQCACRPAKLRWASPRPRACRRQIARHGVVRDRGDFAVLGRADADALDRCRAMRRVVRHQRARQRHLDGPACHTDAWLGMPALTSSSMATAEQICPGVQIRACAPAAVATEICKSSPPAIAARGCTMTVWQTLSCSDRAPSARARARLGGAASSVRSPRRVKRSASAVCQKGDRMSCPASSTEDPEQDREYDRDDDAGHDREVETETFADNVDVTRQPSEGDLRQPRPCDSGGEQQKSGDDEQALHGRGRNREFVRL